MHIAGKGCGKRSSQFQHGDDQDQLHPAEMHNLFSAVQFGGFQGFGPRVSAVMLRCQAPCYILLKRSSPSCQLQLKIRKAHI